jgi:transcription-repair coupling factor (superfamily II helicase)
LARFGDKVIRDAIYNELKRGGQAFFVHNRIDDLEKIANIILKLVPDARVTYAHGQMDGKQLERKMVDFIEHKYDVLVSTNIIESGLDISNANTIIINHAHMFGLSDLHQMRGRVGRSNKKAYCYLLTPPLTSLSVESRKRLKALEDFSDLGSGFKVAMKDLEIRGAGNMLGGEQSGFITDIGFDAYNKVLEDAIKELRDEEFAELFKNDPKFNGPEKTDCAIETDLEILIPESYISNVSERLNIYMQADKLENESQLVKFRDMLQDRFGPLPEPVEGVLKTVRLRWMAESLFFEKLSVKGGNLKAHLPPSEKEAYYKSESFSKVLVYVQKHSKICRLKETGKRLIFSVKGVETIDDALKTLSEIQ